MTEIVQQAEMCLEQTGIHFETGTVCNLYWSLIFIEFVNTIQSKCLSENAGYSGNIRSITLVSKILWVYDII